MASLSRFRPLFRRGGAEDSDPSVVTTGSAPNEKTPTVTGNIDTISPDNANGEPTTEQPEKDLLPTEDAQRGVQQVEAVTLTWTKPYLIAVFILYAWIPAPSPSKCLS